MRGINEGNIAMAGGVALGAYAASAFVRPMVAGFTANGLYQGLLIAIAGLLAMSLDGKLAKAAGAGAASVGASIALASLTTTATV